MADDSIKVVAFDVDGTLVTSSMWAFMHKSYGLPQELDDEWRRQYLDKEIGYVAWMAKLSEFWRQNPKTRTEMEAIHDLFEFQPHAETVIASLAKSYELALISSSQEAYVSRVAGRLGIGRTFAFSFDTYDDDGRFLAMQFTDDISEEMAKVNSIKEIQKEFDCEPHEIVFVGDSRNDLEAFRYTGRGVLVGEGNEDLRASAWKHISLLDELLTFL